MTDQEKLVELLAQVCEWGAKRCIGCKEDTPAAAECREERFGRVADYLIANGVTVQQWIPVTERLPDIKKDGALIQITETVQATDEKETFFGHFKVYKGDGSWMFVCANEDVDLCVTDEITHWIPLHDLPKEE